MATSISAGQAKAGSSTSITEVISASSAAEIKASYSVSFWFSPHWAINRCKIHKPVMFCKKRILPPTPPSLVKPDSRASSVKTGSSSSIPSNDQVPELKNAWRRLVAGATLSSTASVSADTEHPVPKPTVNTALAVSCEPTAITSTS